jgi:hypothetical protein
MLIHEILQATNKEYVFTAPIASPQEYLLYLDHEVLHGAMIRAMNRHHLRFESKYVTTLGIDSEGDEIVANTRLVENTFYVRIRSDVSLKKVGAARCKKNCIQFVLAHEMVHILVGLIRMDHALDDLVWSILMKNTKHDTLFLYILKHLFRITDETVK